VGWSRFFRRGRWDDERSRELQTYLDIETDDNIARGMSIEEARYAARKKLGNPSLIREEIYHMNSIGFLERLWQDLRYASRMLRKNPGFTVVAVVSLALGIGVNTAMFSVIRAVVLRPLPYPQPAQLVQVGQQVTRGGWVTIPEYRFLKEHSRAFSSIAGYRGGGERRLVWQAGQDWISTMTVTTDFLVTLGVRPPLGREFSPQETQAGGPQAIILGDGLWRRSFGADPAVLGQAVTLDNASYTIVGVLRSDFWFPQSADALVPLRPTGSLSDTGTNTQLIARLKDGLTIQQAQAELTAASEGFRRAHAGDVAPDYRGLMGLPYQDSLIRDVRLNLLLLFGATGLLLLIACANLTALLLTRFAARGRELAVRLALGSSRGRFLAQFLVENLLIAALGAGAGVLAAYALLKGLVSWMPFSLPASSPVRLDGTVLAFALVVATATALVFTVVPLLTTRRLNLQASLQSAGRSTETGHVCARIRNVLVIGEVALSTTLLIAAGLLIQSLYHMHQERLGFTPQGLVTFETPLTPELQQGAGRLNFSRALLERLSTLPGVRGVAAINVLPLAGRSNLPTQREGHPEQSTGAMEIRAVTPAYFELMGIPVRRGRSFTNVDGDSSLPVAVINETVARSWWREGDAISDRILIGRFEGREFLKDPPREIVGMVGDTKTLTLQDPPRPTIFIPLTQGLPSSNLAWIVRARVSAGLAEDLRRAVAEIDPSQRVRRLRAMDEIVASMTASSRFNASLFGIFASVAVLLAAIGLYGVLSFLVAQRFQEIGTRMALGAARGDVLMVFLKQGVLLTAIGLGLGLAAALFLTGWLSSLLYGVQPNDPLSFAAISLLLLLVGVAASCVPAYRATRIDPIVALRCD
jgi:putative ABC transport system permease protein